MSLLKSALIGKNNLCKGYREGKKDNFKPIEWQCETANLPQIAKLLMIQNEHWAAKCIGSKLFWGGCDNEGGHGKDEKPYVNYLEKSRSNMLPIIYGNATSVDDFLNSDETEGKLLLMNWQKISQRDKPRFFLGIVEFDNLKRKDNNVITISVKIGTVTITIKDNGTFTIEYLSYKISEIPFNAVWIAPIDATLEKIVNSGGGTKESDLHDLKF